MERLTRRAKSKSGAFSYYWCRCSKDQLIAKLGMYEDLGTPEECKDAIDRTRWSGWVPAGLFDPEDDVRVLCCTQAQTGRKNIVLGYRAAGRWVVGMNPNVIAWMPLPNVFGGEEDAEA